MTVAEGSAGTARRRRWWDLDPAGAVVGLTVAILSVTPSLLPRPALFQGVIAGVAFGLGYLVGAAIWGLIRGLIPAARMPRSQRADRVLWGTYSAMWPIAIATLSYLAFMWQNEVRSHVEMPPLGAVSVAACLAGFLPVAILFLVIGKGLRRMFTSLRTSSGAVVGVLGTTTVIVAGIAALAVIVTSTIDSLYKDLNGAPEEGLAEPSSEFHSAGPDSAIAWEDLGRHGAAFVGGGPSADEIEALTGVDGLEPIRVYAGVNSAPTLTERADLVVSELERTGAFDRAVLVVATATGSGWLEPQAVDAVEYLYAGDTAIASMQYAYTPSWVSFLFDPDAPVDAATILFNAVEERWLELPEDDRPLLVTYGLSLGAHGSQAIFADLDDLRHRVDGALFAGSPDGSALWRTLQASRDAGSPAWQPVLNEGREVRWMSQSGDENALPEPWAEPRVLYLQHSTDPVTWLSPELVWQSPEWLQPDQRAADVSSAMVWIPVVTALQVGIDMLGGEAVPGHHGHNFGGVVTAGWRAAIGDAGLSDAAVQRIAAEIETYAPIQSYEP